MAAMKSALTVPEVPPVLDSLERNHADRIARQDTWLQGRSSRRLASPAQANALPKEGLEEMLSSALLASDSELGQILQEVDTISETLRTNSKDPQTLRIACHPAVWRAVRQAMLDRELRSLALTDDLTCLYNRRGFFAAATQQLKLALRNAQDLCLLLLDVDKLKKINDSYGRREGDLALIHAADALEQAFRGSDILARLGGDEFVVLAFWAPGRGADAVLQRLRKSLKKVTASESRYELSLSVGLARFDPRQPVSLGELIALAEKNRTARKQEVREFPNR